MSEMDLPARLRARSSAVFIAMDEVPATDISNHLKEAADEIERLREVVETMAETFVCDPACGERSDVQIRREFSRRIAIAKFALKVPAPPVESKSEVVG